MPLYEMTAHSFRSIQKASFADLKVRERGDLQRLLRTQIDVIGQEIDDGETSDDDPVLYVLTEEFGDWEDSKRRIDLLAIDRQANLVVIELKRTSDGGHMELQAIRYAAMVSTMTFARAVEIHSEFLGRIDQQPGEAQALILDFLGWSEPNEEEFAPDVRMVLVSQDFGKELTTAVLWLREREIDIRCVRLRPYFDSGRHLIDVQQVIPLPEAAEYQIQLREKEQEEKKSRAAKHGLKKRFWDGLLLIARQRGTRHGNLKSGEYTWIGAGSGIGGLGFNFTIGQDSCGAELYIDRKDPARNKAIFDSLHSHQQEIERAFGGPLNWQRLDNKQACRIRHEMDCGGYRSPESQWPAIQTEMVEAMSRLEGALTPALDRLDL